MASKVERLTITLTTELAHEVKESVVSGAYASSSEVIREALRDWRHKRRIQAQQIAKLRSDVMVGIADVEAGRVREFSADRIIERGRAKLSDR